MEPGPAGEGNDCIFLNGRFVGDCLADSAPSESSEMADSEEDEKDSDLQNRCIFMNGMLVCKNR